MGDGIERSTPENSPPAPSQIGRYPIVGRLGKGGQAETFRAIHPGFQTTVVLKLAHRPADPTLIDRIENEGRLLASLPAHPHLVKVHDVDLHEGHVFLVLEDVPGSTLEQYAKDRPPDARWAAQTVATIARAMHLAHEQGITHLDLNPRNILIDREGQPRVIDFGMAWSRPWSADEVDASAIGGTFAYFSPEQAWARSEQIGRATDVFGLGGILYFLLTGTPLYAGNSLLCRPGARRASTSFDRERLDRPSIPPGLRAICITALAAEPKDRFATAAALAQALERCIAPSRWRFPALLALLFVLSFGLAWGIQAYRGAATSIIERPTQPGLEVQIWRPDTQFLPLLTALPIKTGDEFQVRCHASKGEGVSIYFVDRSGRLQLLKQFPAADDDREVLYPGPEQARSLKGPPGTEMILALREPNAPSTEELQRIWDSEVEAGPLPMLPEATVARMTVTGVDSEGQRARDLGEIHDRSDPREKIRRRLDEFRKKLEARSTFFEGVAFARE